MHFFFLGGGGWCACVLRVLRCVSGTACVHARVPSTTPSTLSHPLPPASKRAKRHLPSLATLGLQYLSWCQLNSSMDRYKHIRPGLQIGVHFAYQLFHQIVIFAACDPVLAVFQV